MDVKNTHSVTKTEISVFGRQALDAERRRSPSLAGKVFLDCLYRDSAIAIESEAIYYKRIEQSGQARMRVRNAICIVTYTAPL